MKLLSASILAAALLAGCGSMSASAPDTPDPHRPTAC